MKFCVTMAQLQDEIRGFQGRRHRTPTKLIVKAIILAEARLLLASATQEQREQLRWEDDGGR